MKEWEWDHISLNQSTSLILQTVFHLNQHENFQSARIIMGIHVCATMYVTHTHTHTDLDSLSRVHFLHLIAQLVHNSLASYGSRTRRRG